MAKMGRPKGKTKVKMTISIDEELRKEMASIEKVIPVNWSEIINEALLPNVKLIKVAIEEFSKLKKGDVADIEKVKYILQGNIIKLMGTAHEGMIEVDKDIEKAKAKHKKVKE